MPRRVAAVVLLLVVTLGPSLMIWRFQQASTDRLVSACHRRNEGEIWRRNLLRELSRVASPDEKEVWSRYLGTAPPLVDCEAIR